MLEYVYRIGLTIEPQESQSSKNNFLVKNGMLDSLCLIV